MIHAWRLQGRQRSVIAN